MASRTVPSLPRPLSAPPTRYRRLPCAGWRCLACSPSSWAWASPGCTPTSPRWLAPMTTHRRRPRWVEGGWAVASQCLPGSPALPSPPLRAIPHAGGRSSAESSCSAPGFVSAHLPHHARPPCAAPATPLPPSAPAASLHDLAVQLRLHPQRGALVPRALPRPVGLPHLHRNQRADHDCRRHPRRPRVHRCAHNATPPCARRWRPAAATAARGFKNARLRTRVALLIACLALPCPALPLPAPPQATTTRPPAWAAPRSPPGT